MRKIDKFIYITLVRILSFIFLVKELLFNDYYISLVYILGFIMIIIFKFRKNKFSFYIENFIYLLIFTYEFNGLYNNIPFWDTLMHSITGFFFCFFPLYIYKKRKFKLSLFMLSLFCFSFSLIIGVMFELHEYTMDKLFSRDMQKDMLINEIHTVRFKDNISEFNHFLEIDKTIIYYKKNGEVFDFVIENGYLDIGLNDTMKDLYVNFIGSFLASASIYFKRKYIR